MNSFKDFLASDIATFINSAEFAETHEFMGVEMEVVETSDERNDAKLGKKIELLLDGVYTTFKRINFASGNVEMPREGDLVTYDGTPYTVLSSSEADGMTTVELALTSDGD